MLKLKRQWQEILAFKLHTKPIDGPLLKIAIVAESTVYKWPIITKERRFQRRARGSTRPPRWRSRRRSPWARTTLRQCLEISEKSLSWLWCWVVGVKGVAATFFAPWSYLLWNLIKGHGCGLNVNAVGCLVRFRLPSYWEPAVLKLSIVSTFFDK